MAVNLQSGTFSSLVPIETLQRRKRGYAIIVLRRLTRGLANNVVYIGVGEGESPKVRLDDGLPDNRLVPLWVDRRIVRPV